MNLLILHLSDIHLKSARDPVLKRVEAIIASLRPHLPHTGVIAIVVSGDIAQSGSKAEYAIAKRFLADLRGRLKGEVAVPSHFILAPGNHDCDFSADQAARQLVVDAVLKHAGPLPESYLKSATKVQSNFFNFRKELETKTAIVFEDQLWTTYSFSLNGFKVAFDVLNASWMSTRHEQQGGLLFPFDGYANRKTETDLQICVLHHPLNWYSQSNYRAFRTFIHRRSDFILTGHEHHAATREIDDAADGQSIYIEGEALQTTQLAHSAFNILVVNTITKEYRSETVKLDGSRYEPQTHSAWDAFRPLAKRDASRLAFTDEFVTQLKDPGATLKHPSGRDLNLDDIYVYPDLDDRSDDAKNSDKARGLSLNASFLARPDRIDSDILIQGDDESGKTRLIYKLASEYHSRGYLPLILRGDKLKSATASTITAAVEAAAIVQYGLANKTAFRQTAKAEKILLLDDFDRCSLNAERKAILITEVKEHFGRLILTVGESFEVAELFGGTDILSLAQMRHVKIMPLGNARRLELIRKRNGIGRGEATSENQFLRSCDDAEKLIEVTKLRFVASTSPIFVLSLLQATASGITSEMHNSSFAHYYYFLIIGALDRAKVAKNQLNTILSACTHLSWFIRNYGDNQLISITQFNEFVAAYSEEWTATNPMELLQILVDSRLLEQDGDTLTFTYPYSYYYFLGKYASISQGSPEVLQYIQYCLQHMYVRECANTLLFLAHHSGNSMVLENVVTAIDGHFSGKKPASLEKEDIATIASLLSQAPALKYQKVTPTEYRETNAARRDQSDHEHDGLQDKPNSSTRDLVQEIVSLSKAIEIAGTLLTHQVSNYDRKTKNSAIQSMFDGAMRAVKMFHSHFENVDELLKSIASRTQEKNRNLSAEQIEMNIRNAIAHLLKIVTTSFVIRAASSLRAKDLNDNILSVVQTNPTCANRLIKLAQELQHPSRLPRLEVDRLRRDEGTNPAVMGVLQLLVLQRLYMYETHHDDKDWAMGVFELGGSRTDLELNKKGVSVRRLRS
jgi:predicted MPP superfamily phosphohydrolase